MSKRINRPVVARGFVQLNDSDPTVSFLPSSHRNGEIVSRGVFQSGTRVYIVRDVYYDVYFSHPSRNCGVVSFDT